MEKEQIVVNEQRVTSESYSLCEWQIKAEITDKSTIRFYLTCVSGGAFHPGALHKCCCKRQSILHHVQKGGDFPVILEDSTGQESVDHRQQSLHGGVGGLCRENETELD